MHFAPQIKRKKEPPRVEQILIGLTSIETGGDQIASLLWLFFFPPVRLKEGRGDSGAKCIILG